MIQEHDLPDTKRREELSELLSRLQRAERAVGDLDLQHDEVPGDTLATAYDDLGDAIEEVQEELNAIPEWDDGFVQDLVLKYAGRPGTTTERVDNEVCLKFVAGSHDDGIECRYAVGPTTENEWFHVRTAGESDWNEVWRN